MLPTLYSYNSTQEVCVGSVGGLRRDIAWTHWPRTLVYSLLGLLNCEIGGLDCRVITTEYKPRVHRLHMLNLSYNTLVHVIQEYQVNISI